MPVFNLFIFLIGCAGGLLPDVLRFIKDRYNKDLPDYFHYPQFWVGLVLLVMLGGFAAWLLGAKDLLSALSYGFTAPELLSGVLSRPSSGQTPIDRGSKGFDLRAWWAV